MTRKSKTIPERRQAWRKKLEAAGLPMEITITRARRIWRALPLETRAEALQKMRGEK